jgi:3'-5' exonuclease
VIKGVKDRVWAFDIEWVPDPVAGRVLHRLPADTPDREAMEALWRAGGASAEDPTPFIKTVLCRIVSIAAVERRVRGGNDVVVNLMSLPRDVESPHARREANVIGTFLEALGEHGPQLVGFNSLDADIKILIQRGVVLGVEAGGFCSRPEKPWEGVDYFARGSDFNIDLKDVLGGWGKSVPSLHEIASLSGIPGKMDVDGNQVARLWLEGRLDEIVRYNEYDALTTYLVWLRLAHFAGHFNVEEYVLEQQRIRELLEVRSQKPEGAHLARYLAEWERLRLAARPTA